MEILLADWHPRKVTSPDRMHVKVPDVLWSWIRFAGRTLGVPPRLVEESVAAAKAAVQQMLELGVDLTDPDAIISHLGGPRPGHGRRRTTYT